MKVVNSVTIQMMSLNPFSRTGSFNISHLQVDDYGHPLC